MLDRIWDIMVGTVTAASLLMLIAIGALAPTWAQLVIASMLVAALAISRRKLHLPTRASATMPVASGCGLAKSDDIVDATLMAGLDGAIGSFDHDLASQHPEYVAAYAAARPIEEEL